ncbi:Ditrans,polycis-undecaprenyl-diphosphate synthase ((2E,6E)-farnesyl-diphosphate specific) [Streptomyces afghaniensis]
MKLPFFSKKQAAVSDLFLNETIPEHVAIIMDGNGRWAKEKRNA